MLEVNQPGDADNFIFVGAKGATLTVTLAGVSPGDYSVTLSKDSGTGTVTFPTNPVKVKAPGSATVDLTGGTPGNVKIKGTCTDLEDGTVDAVVCNFVVDEVKFSAASGAMHDVALDATGKAYPAIHWKRDRKTQSPVCYERAAKMKVEVKFVATAGATGTLIVRGNGNGFTFADKEAKIVNGIAAVLNWEADKAFANAVDIIDPMDLSWEVSADGGITWTPAGKSSNQMYVILGKPAQYVSGFDAQTGKPVWKNLTIFHTVVHVSCKAAKGKSNNNAIITAVWGVFEGKDVRRVDGRRLTYYADYRTKNNLTEELLKSGDSECGAWVRLFLDMLKVHGISLGNEVFAEVRPQRSLPRPQGLGWGDGTGFAVQTWNFVPGGGGKTGSNTYTHLNLDDNPLLGATEYRWRGGYAEAIYASGIPGQGGVLKPASLFRAHYLAKIGADYYDPSYGKKYIDFSGIKISGYYTKGSLSVSESDVGIDLDGDGKLESTVIVPVHMFDTPATSKDALAAALYPY